MAKESISTIKHTLKYFTLSQKNNTVVFIFLKD